MARALWLAVLSIVHLVVAQNPWDRYNLSPNNTRTLHPIGIFECPVSRCNGLFPLTLSTGAASVVYDFGKEVGGFVTVTCSSATGGSVGVAFSESTFYVQNSDNSNGGSGADGTISFSVPRGATSPAAYLINPGGHLRGGFRYLRLFAPPGATVTITGISLQFTAAPTMTNPSSYANHFYSSDDLLNRIWYGGAYTAQLCCIDPQQGRQWPPPSSGWNNGVNVGTGTTMKTVLVDGAKRDRMVWPGDMGVSVLTNFAGTGDVLSSQNALTTLYSCQQSNGMMPYVGPPICGWLSDTYHLWALIGTSSVFTYSNDKTWLAAIWPGFQRAIAASLAKVGANNLMIVTDTADWARCCQGGLNTGANALLYKALVGGATLANAMGDSSLAQSYVSTAAKIKVAINANMWDNDMGAYRDNPSSTLYPQDGNSIAVWYGVANATQATRISRLLETRWNAFGAQCPEWNMDIGTFPSSMEVHAHFVAGRPATAMNLIRLMWGYMLQYPNSTQSTFWEGYHKDGTFAYQGNYMSNSHGWATGPVAALSFNAVGLHPITPGGTEYRVAPQFGDLTHCEGQLTFLPGHVVKVTWDVSPERARVVVDARGHAGSVGVLEVPVTRSASADVVVEVNGEIAWMNGLQRSASSVRMELVEGRVVAHGLTPELYDFTIY